MKPCGAATGFSLRDWRPAFPRTPIRLVYVANEDRNMVTVIDIEKCASLRQVPVGEQPWDVFIAAP